MPEFSRTAEWLRAANPLRRSDTEADALRAARAGALGAGLLALQSVVTIGLSLTTSRQLFEAIEERSASLMPAGSADDPGAAEMMAAMFDAMPVFVATMSAVFAVILAVLALVQWRRPNAVIPAILLALGVYGIVNFLAALTNPLLRDLPVSHWRQASGWAVSLVSVVLFAASLRGALRLAELRRQGGATGPWQEPPWEARPGG